MAMATNSPITQHSHFNIYKENASEERKKKCAYVINTCNMMNARNSYVSHQENKEQTEQKLLVDCVRERQSNINRIA